MTTEPHSLERDSTALAERSPDRPAVVLTDVSRVFGRGPESVHALDKVSLTVKPGEFVCLVGASGCGKSTLLTLVAGLDQPSGGSITLNGTGTSALMFQNRRLFRLRTVVGTVRVPL